MLFEFLPTNVMRTYIYQKISARNGVLDGLKARLYLGSITITPLFYMGEYI